MLSAKDSILPKIRKHEKYQICIRDLVSHLGITLIMFGRSVIQPVCLFDVYLSDGLKSPLLKKGFSCLNLYKAVKSSGLVVKIRKTKVFADETNSG